MKSRPLDEFEARFLMVVGVLVLLAVALRVVLRPEVAILGTADLWIKWSLFAATMFLFACTTAADEESDSLFAFFVILTLLYVSSFAYMYVEQGVYAGMSSVAFLTLAMFLVSFSQDERDWGWPDYIYALWIGVGVSTSLAQKGILIDAADYRSAVELAPSEIPLRWLLDLRIVISILLLLTIIWRAISAAFNTRRSSIRTLPEWLDLSLPEELPNGVEAVFKPVIGAVNVVGRIVRWLANFTWMVIATVSLGIADIALALYDEVTTMLIKNRILQWSARIAGAFLIGLSVIRAYDWFSVVSARYLLSDDFNEEIGLLLICFCGAVALGVLSVIHSWLLGAGKNGVASAEATAGMLICCVLAAFLCFIVGFLPWQHHPQGFDHPGPAIWVAGLIAVVTVAFVLLDRRADNESNSGFYSLNYPVKNQAADPLAPSERTPSQSRHHLKI